MDKFVNRELPVRAKAEMGAEVASILSCLHRGDREEADRLIDDLKSRSLYLGEQVQQNVLIFAEQVHFQYDYDPWHKITPDVELAADKLLKSLGLEKQE